MLRTTPWRNLSVAKKKARAKSAKKTKRKTKAKSKTRVRAKAKSKSKSKSTKSKPKAKAGIKPKMASATPATPVTSVSSLPDMEVQTTGGQRLSLASLKGKNVVLYFYPKDDTPGCTTEGCDLRDHHGELQSLNTVVLGVS